ncbi:MAG: exopolysaccharide biosynthesis protein [Candidatus Didemnitutus sp.]|nr:exopolysaccharide biosynthesis protein [Candidatus Didemnitutus sp.]
MPFSAYSSPHDPLRRLSDDLHALSVAFSDHAVTLGEVMGKLGARASALLIVVCSLPFCSPVTIPGLSTPFGLVILILALRFAAGLPPWLPARLRDVKLPPKFFARVLEAGSRIVGWIERQLRPRWDWLSDAPWKIRLHTLVVAAAAVLLLLPLPPVPPLTNTLPALVIVVLTMSLLERDGFGIAAGYTLFVGTVGYFAFWATVIVEAVRRILERLGG